MPSTKKRVGFQGKSDTRVRLRLENEQLTGDIKELEGVDAVLEWHGKNMAATS